MEWTPDEPKRIDHITRHLADLKQSLFKRGKWRWAHEIEYVTLRLEQVEEARVEDNELLATIDPNSNRTWNQDRLEGAIRAWDRRDQSWQSTGHRWVVGN
jgi:hypothetical protein